MFIEGREVPTKYNMNKNFLIIFFFVFWGHGHCQYKDTLHQPNRENVGKFDASYYENMLHQPYREKVDDIDILYYHVARELPDSTAAFAFIDKFREWAVKNEDEELVLEADMLRAYYYREFYSQEHPELIKYLIAVAEEGKKRGIKHIEERAVQAVAVHYWKAENYEKVFEWLARSEKILQALDPEEFPNKPFHLNFIGRAYYYFEDYEKAIKYYEKSSLIAPTDFNAHAIMYAKNTLGLCYQKMGRLTIADRYFRSIIDDTSGFAKEVYRGLASGNLGYNYYLRENYQKAIPLLQYDVEIALKYDDIGLVAGSTIVLADIYLRQDKLKKSKRELEKATQYIRVSKRYDRNRKLFPVKAKWYAKMGMADKSAAYMDSSLIALKTYRQKFDALKLMRANQKITAQERELQIGKIKAESREKIVQRNTLIAIVLVLLAAGAIFYWFRNKYLLRQKEIKELQLQNTNEALGHARTRLRNLTQKTLENKKLIERLQQGNGNQADPEVLQELKIGTILTEEDWGQYQLLFEQAYPGFLHKLKTAHHDFTQAELRCLCLEKLCLTNKEMATVLGVSPNTAMVTKSRIRKKLKIKTKKGLQHWVQAL